MTTREAVDETTIPTRTADADEESRGLSWWAHVLVGAIFGVILTKAEAISWFRIQEMFRFQSFHMYGVIGSAVAVGALALFIIRKTRLSTVHGQTIEIPPKDFGTGARVAIGGTLFGLGWGLTGACPGPIYVLIGNGVTVMAVVLASALAGTWIYGVIKPKLPH